MFLIVLASQILVVLITIIGIILLLITKKGRTMILWPLGLLFAAMSNTIVLLVIQSK